MKSFISTGLAGRLTRFTLIGRSPVAVWPCCFFLHLGGSLRQRTDAGAHCEQGAGSANSPASAADKSFPPPAGLAAASGSRREGIPDPEGSGKICVRGAELQSRPLGSGA